MSTAMTPDEAFTRFVKESTPTLTRTAWLLTGDREVAADLVQSAYVRTLQAWGKVADGAATAYARRVIANENIDRWRRRRGEVLVPDVQDRPAAGSFETRIADADRVVRMLAELNPQQRKVVVLRYYDDLAEDDVARLLGMSIQAVRSTAHRALTTLRRHYAAEALEGGRA